MEAVVTDENRALALAAVRRNKGAAGIDRMRTTELESHLQAHWEKIRAKLLAGTYVPSPVRPVEIPKPSGGTRTLGIPTVQDRFIQQLLLQMLTPIFEAVFSESSYGFRPGRSAQDAVRAAQRYAQEGKDWVVDLDITKFFRPCQSRHSDGPGRNNGPGQTGAALDREIPAAGSNGGRAGGGQCGRDAARRPAVTIAGEHLDALDKELDQRRHSYCRYADDCNIYLGSQAAAERTLASIQDWIEKHLRLKVNAAKSGTGRIAERKFLGFRLDREGRIGVAPESVERFKTKVREMWRANRSRTSNQLRDDWKRYVRGWWGYFQLAEARRAVFNLEGWIRRHIRKCFWQRWHSAVGRERGLRRLGLRGQMLKVAFSSRGAWPLAANGSVQTALSNATLKRFGFLMPSDLARNDRAEFNRRMRKTARPVAWEGDRALTPGHST